MTKETLAMLINSYQGTDLAGFIFSELELDKSIARDADGLRQAEINENIRHKTELEQLKGKWCTLRRRCPHHESTYYGDVTGGKDSETLCDLCGARIN